MHCSCLPWNFHGSGVSLDLPSKQFYRGSWNMPFLSNSFQNVPSRENQSHIVKFMSQGKLQIFILFREEPWVLFNMHYCGRKQKKTQNAHYGYCFSQNRTLSTFCSLFLDPATNNFTLVDKSELKSLIFIAPVPAEDEHCARSAQRRETKEV